MPRTMIIVATRRKHGNESEPRALLGDIVKRPVARRLGRQDRSLDVHFEFLLTAYGRVQARNVSAVTSKRAELSALRARAHRKSLPSLDTTIQRGPEGHALRTLFDNS